MKGRYRWTDEQIMDWAFYYISDATNTLEILETNLGVSHSTAWWCFLNRLVDINESLYNRVIFQMQGHQGHSHYKLCHMSKEI